MFNYAYVQSKSMFNNIFKISQYILNRIRKNLTLKFLLKTLHFLLKTLGVTLVFFIVFYIWLYLALRSIRLPLTS